MKHCPSCGARYDDAVDVCPVHGAELLAGLAASPAPQPASRNSKPGCSPVVFVVALVALARACAGGLSPRTPTTPNLPRFEPPPIPRLTVPPIPELPALSLPVPVGAAALEIAHADWVSGTAGAEAAWRVTIRNRGTAPASRIEYRALYFSEEGESVRVDDGVIEATVPAGSTRTLEVRGGRLERSAATAYLVLRDSRRISAPATK